MSEPRWVIWKYSFGVDDEAVFEDFPKQHTILKVGAINDVVYVWALVNPDGPKQKLHFRVVGTGHFLTEDEVLHLNYLDTVFTHNNVLVWHVFNYERR
jgi:hypothetical protein